MSETNRPHQARDRGFTIVEMLVIAPIVILTIGAFVGVIISMTGEVLATRTSNVMAYDIQGALSRIEDDAKLSTTFLEANHITISAPSKQGFNNDTTGFANVSATATIGNMLILNTLATTGNPLGLLTNNSPVYLANTPNACSSPQVNQNTPMTVNIVYFLKPDGAGTYTLWRRTVMPANYLTAGCPAGAKPWQQPSCAPGQIATMCAAEDVRLIDKLKVSDFAVQYFNTADSTGANVTASNAAALPSDRYDQLKLATTVGVTINVTKTAAGRDVTQAGTVRVTKLDSSASSLAVSATAATPAVPTVTASISDPNSTLFPNPTFKYPAVVFTWPAVPGATSYTMQYQIDGGAFTTIAPANCTDTTTCVVNAPRNSIVIAQVRAVNSAGQSNIGSATIHNLAWTNLVTQNNWDDFSQGYSTAAYTKTSSGVVMLKGVLKRTGALSAGEVIGVLPIGYRAGNLYNSFLTSTSPNAVSRINVDSSGNITITSGSSAWVSLDGIKFMANDSIYAFTAATLSNSWINNAGSYTVAGYTFDGSGRTHIQGAVKNGAVTDGTLIAALPAAYRPSEYLTLPAFNNGFGMTGINPVATGIVAKGGVNTFLTLNSMFYPNTYAGWTNLTLQNGWVWNGTVYSTPQYTKAADGIVTLKGQISGGTATAGTVIANLPAGYRPKQNLIQTVVSNGVYGRVDVTTTGDITVQLASNAWLSLDGISFIYDP